MDSILNAYVSPSPETGLSADSAKQLDRALNDPATRAKLFALVQRTLTCGNRHDAEDVVQDVLVRAFKTRARFEGRNGSSIDSWLFRIAINSFSNMRKIQNKRYQKEVSLDEGTLHLDFLPSIATESVEQKILEEEAAVLSAREIQRMKVFISQLPVPMREALVMQYEGGKDYKAIAAVQKVPVGTVRSRIFRAKEIAASRMNGANKEQVEPARDQPKAQPRADAHTL